MNARDLFWRSQAAYYEGLYNEATTKILAVCHTVGFAGYLLSPACTATDAERLVLIAQTITDLRAALDPHHDRSATTDTNPTSCADTKDGDRL